MEWLANMLIMLIIRDRKKITVIEADYIKSVNSSFLGSLWMPEAELII